MKPKAGEPSASWLEELWNSIMFAWHTKTVDDAVQEFGANVWREARERAIEESAQLIDPLPEPEGLPTDTGRMWRRSTASACAELIRALAARKP